MGPNQENEMSMTTAGTLSRLGHFRPRPITLALALSLASPVAWAQDTGWYLGGNFGETRAEVDDDSIVNGLRNAGFSTLAINLDDEDTGWKLLGGYNFNRYFALEGSYNDLGDFGFNTSLLPTATQIGKASVRGLALDLVGTLPLKGNLSLFGRIGINNLEIKQSFTNPMPAGGFTGRSDRGTNEKYGAGLQYRLNDAFSLRAEMERFKIDDNSVTADTVDLYSVGFVYRFGARPAPAPVAQPAPAPAPPPAPAPVQLMEVTLGAEALFDFDRSELKPEGRQELDELLRDIQSVNYEVVIVTGHTDRIGTRNYNIALSERRAATVRNYLVNGGIPAARITSSGVNSDQPVTTPQQCQGPVSDALKACLQPDRRVVVVVTGTREGE